MITIQKTKQRYQAYRPTNIDWIGEIPVDWEKRKISHLFKVDRWRVIDKTQISVDQTDDQKYPVFSSQTQNNWCLWYIETYDYDKDSITWTTDWANAGSVFFRQGKFNATNVCWILTMVEKNQDYKYLTYCIRVAALNNRRVDILWYKLMSNEMASIRIPLPPLTEQQAIADYLDTKTAQIDQIISLKQQQIELLKERRTALINHVMTKGLNPKVEMIDSGIEWIGMIPKGWEVNKIKWFITIASGTSLSNEKFDEFGSYSVVWWNGEMGKSNEYNCEWNVIVVWRVWAHCWNIHIIKERTWITDNALIIDRINWFDLEYLATILRIRGLNDIASKNAQPLITWTQVKEQFICKPTISEQQSIADYLDSKTSQIDQTITAVEKSIELLSEYKQSLISHVVTGKVKVF